MLETDGYDGLQVREVARRAHVSLTKVYKLYGTREQLILVALDWWAGEHCWSGLADRPAEPGESLHAAVMRVFRPAFQPWEEHPGLLRAYARARAAPGGEILIRHGFDAVLPPAIAAMGGTEPEVIEEFTAIITNMVYGLVGRVNNKEVEATEIVPLVDRAMYWLTTGYEATRRRPSR